MHSSLYTLSYVLGVLTELKWGRINPKISSETTSLSATDNAAGILAETAVQQSPY